MLFRSPGEDTADFGVFDPNTGGSEVGGILPGLSLSESRIDGSVDPAAGTSYLEWQLNFRNELQQVIEIARANGAARDPVMRQRLADAWIGLEIMRYNALRMLSHAEGGELRREAMITKIYWATWHRNLGKLAMDVLGAESEIAEAAPYELSRLQRLYLFTRSDTIYAGSNEIQRNLIAERALGMPREPRA